MLTRGIPTPRRGFTVIEILVTGIVLAIFGVLFVRYVLTQNRFADQIAAVQRARDVSRAAMNILESELRMVQDSGGVLTAAADGKTLTVLVPYRMGLNCGVQGGATVVSLLPADSVVVAQAVYNGFAWRGGDGSFTYVFPGAPLGSDAPKAPNNTNKCTGTGNNQAEISTMSIKGRAGAVLELSPSQASAPVGAAVFLFQRVTYTFKSSTNFPGQEALFRSVSGGTEEEIMGPFDASARFKYWKPGATSAISAPPALDSIRGVDVLFVAQSSYTPLGSDSYSEATSVASIFFRNVRVQ